MHAVRAKLLVDLGELLLADEHAAHAGAHDHADPMRVLALQAEPGVLDRLLGGGERELGVAVEAVGLDGVRQARGIEVEHLAGHLRPVAVERQPLERRDRGDAGAAGQRVLPEGLGSDADRGHDAEARHDHRLAAPGRGARADALRSSRLWSTYRPIVPGPSNWRPWWSLAEPPGGGGPSVS